MISAPRALLAVGFALALVPGPAFAQGRPVLPDVPADHWASKAVEEVAVNHRLMPLFKDGSFRGEAPLNRLDFARTVAKFIQELEVTSGVALADSAFSFYAFDDLEPADRVVVEPLANQYNIFDQVPGIEAHRFDPKRPVTRYELAGIFDKVLKLAEKKRLVTPPISRTVENPFTDLKRLDWAYEPVLNTVLRYQILTGFPDATFRGNQEINRYQFAAAAAQAFSTIREQSSGLVRQRLPQGLKLGSRFAKYHGENSSAVVIGLVRQFSFSGSKPLEALGGMITTEPSGGRFGLAVSSRTVEYPVIPMPNGGFSTRMEDTGFDLFVLAPRTASDPEAALFVPAEDFNLLGSYSVRTWPDAPNLDPYHIQLYYELAGLGTLGGGSKVQLGAGGAGLGGFLLQYRAPIYAISISVGAGPAALVGGRYNFNPAAPGAFVALRSMVKAELECNVFSGPTQALVIKGAGYVLPGGLYQDAVPVLALGTLSSAVSLGFSWR